ncbi:tRNA (guanine(9)-N(1))-methyltransferase [Sporobolomyces koalae]|uniref:tRNA (guanine(9)-N(1))-methyltransferase n=1 Tax=Sporobolomyces koalae TaxID=500713 RepID=UPI003182219D
MAEPSAAACNTPTTSDEPIKVTNSNIDDSTLVNADSPAEGKPADSTTTTAADAESAPAVPMTKSALKRQRRQELYESQKLLRRAREKEKKKEKAAEKRKLIEEGVIEPPERKKRKKGEVDANGGKKVEYGARIVIDIGFDELMHEKEVKSMSSQVAYCYAANRNATQPFPILVSSFNKRLKQSYAQRDDHLHWKGVEWWEEGFELLYEGAEEPHDHAAAAEPAAPVPKGTTTKEETATVDDLKAVKLGVYAGQPRSTAPKSSVIYLTGDSPNVLTSIEPGHTYVLGGIVDHNRYKNLCLNKANELGIQHAQLPIGQYLPEMATRKVLTVNQVFEIMVNWVESVRERKQEMKAAGKTDEEIAKAEGDWREALRKVMPERKFDKDGRAKKRAERKAARQKEAREKAEREGEVYIVELDDEDDEEDSEGENDAVPPETARTQNDAPGPTDQAQAETPVPAVDN